MRVNILPGTSCVWYLTIEYWQSEIYIYILGLFWSVSVVCFLKTARPSTDLQIQFV